MEGELKKTLIAFLKGLPNKMSGKLFLKAVNVLTKDIADKTTFYEEDYLKTNPTKSSKDFIWELGSLIGFFSTFALIYHRKETINTSEIKLYFAEAITRGNFTM